MVLFTMNSYAQNKITGYQYAFNDGQNLQYVNISPTDIFHLDTDLDVSNLDGIINTLHLRFVDETGNWSPIISKLFIRPLDGDGTSDVKIIAYEYFFNDDIASTESVNVGSTDELHLISDLDVSNLSGIINTINIRFKDSQGRWSSLVSKLFIKPLDGDGTTDVKITAYEYFFNDDTANTESVNVGSTDELHLISDLDISNLSGIINTINIRFKDSQDRWSPLVSKLFIKPLDGDGTTDVKITGYEYYFNNDVANKESVDVSSTDELHLISDLDISKLSGNINIINIRFKDSQDRWSPLVSKLFIRPLDGDGTSDTKITGYEYYFNNDVANKESVEVSSTDELHLIADIDVNKLDEALNVFNIRFKNNKGKWSPMLYKLFFNPPKIVETDIKIVSYEYWVDDDVINKKIIKLNTDVDELNVSDFDLRHIWEGEHLLHTQYKDSEGNYSIVTSDTITKVPYSFATFDMSNSDVCEESNISFTNNSVDYNTQLWDFGDGTTSNKKDPMHEFLQEGTYNVKLTVSNTDDDRVSDTTRVVNVYNYPVNTVTTSETSQICYGNTAILTSDAIDATYVWSTGETTRSIEVNKAGNYNVRVSNPHHTDCFVISNDIEISFLPELDNQVVMSNEGVTNCFGEPVTLTALAQDNVTYLWNTGETTQSVEVTNSDMHTVTITSTLNNNCSTVSDEIQVEYYPEINNAVEDNGTSLCALQEGATYQWLDCDKDSSPIAGATDKCFTPLVSGNYSVQITQNGCTVVSECFNSLSISDDILYKQVKVYPNPIDNQLLINSEYEVLEVELYNANGTKVLHRIINNKNVDLDTRKLSPGLYMVKLKIHIEGDSSRILDYRIIKN